MRPLFIGFLLVTMACGAPTAPRDFVLRVAVASPFSAGKEIARNGISTIYEEWIYEPLVRFSATGELVPALADRFEEEPDGRFRIHIRNDATFSDGSRVTPQDLITALADNGLTPAIAGSDVLVASALPGIPIESLLPFVVVTKESNGVRIGTGPYQIVERESDHLVLKRRVAVRGKINSIRMTSYAGAREAMAHVLRGDENSLLQIEARNVEFVQGVKRLRVIRGTAPNVIVVAMNQKRLSQGERIALVNSIPVDEISSTVFGKDCVPWAHSTKAASALPTRPLQITTAAADAELPKVSLALRRSLGAMGGELKRVSLEEEAVAFKTGDFDLAVVNMLIWPPRIATLMLHSGSPSGIFGYSNPAVDRALESGDWPATLSALAKDPPVVFVCTRDRVAVVDSRIKNPRLGPWGLFETLPEWDVGE